MKLSYFDLLGNHKIRLSGKIYLIPPTLRSIRDLEWDRYILYRRFISMDLVLFLEVYNLKNFHYSLSEEEQRLCTFYYYIINNQELREIYLGIFNYFIDGKTIFDQTNNTFNINLNDELIGVIDEGGFDEVLEALCQLNDLEFKKTIPKKFKNEKARLLYEKIEKAKSENKFMTGGIDIPTMISKFCTINNNGINILNVDEMTIFQLFDQFNEYSYIRSVNIQDAIYTNSVTLSDINKYSPQMWTQNKNH